MKGKPIYYVTHKEGFGDKTLYFEVYIDGYIKVLKDLSSRDFVAFGDRSSYQMSDFTDIYDCWKYLTKKEVLLLRADAALKY